METIAELIKREQPTFRAQVTIIGIHEQRTHLVNAALSQPFRVAAGLTRGSTKKHIMSNVR